jgi:hypothetical protein
MSETQAVTNWIQDIKSDQTTISNSLSAIETAVERDAKQYGATYVTGVTTTTGSFNEIYFLTAGNLTSVTAGNITGSTNISSGTTLAANTSIFGNITKVKTKVGAFLLYARSS